MILSKNVIGLSERMDWIYCFLKITIDKPFSKYVISVPIKIIGRRWINFFKSSILEFSKLIKLFILLILWSNIIVGKVVIWSYVKKYPVLQRC